MRIFIYTFVITIFFTAATAYAQTAPTNLCEGDALAKLFCEKSIAGMLNQAFKLSLSVGAVLAMLRIGYAGYLYMGQDYWGTKEHAKEVFRDSIQGLLILLAIWLILYQINPDILTLQGLE